MTRAGSLPPELRHPLDLLGREIQRQAPRRGQIDVKPRSATCAGASPSGATVTIATASFISFRQSVATSRPYERNRSLRIDRQGRPRTDAW